jgi:ribonuclease BN (tRNA processing enzyme)
MQLTVLGTGTISLSAARACAGYLVEHESAVLLMDCGTGTARRLAELELPWRAITHVAITHFHIDHYGDLAPLIFAWKHGVNPPRAEPLDIIGPVGTHDLMQRLAAAHGPWVLDPGFPLRITELAPGASFDLSSDFRLSTCRVPHTPESVAYSVTAGAQRLVYTGDTGFDPALGEWARGCDILLCECSLPESMAIPEHLTPGQCGALAELARPGRLVLTHLYPPVEAVDIAEAVAGRFKGPMVVAYDGWETDI